MTNNSTIKRKILIITLTALTVGLLSSCSKINERIDGLDKRIYELENDKIASVQQQISAINQSIADLETIRTNIRDLIAAKDAQGQDIATLKAADQTLEGNINNLKDYVDTELAKYATKDWANATFATLEKQAEIIADVSKLKMDLTGLDEKLDRSIEDLDSSLKSWVNEQLSAYYKKAEMDEKLKSLQDEIEGLKTSGETDKTKISELETKLTKLTRDLEAAKATIKTEYEAAIAKAIRDNNGTITRTIQTKIGQVNATITALTARVETLETTVAALSGDVNALKAMIQTVSIIPAYSDGSVKAENGTLTVDFVVSPVEAVKGVKAGSIKVLVHKAKVQTKAASSYITLPVASAYVDETTGNVTITADISGITPAEGKGLTVAINVKNGISDYTTEFVPVYVASAPSPAADYVEIGGVKWATKNLGATTVAGSLETCAGDYYAWGETEPYYGTLTWDNATGTFSDWKTGKTDGYVWQSYCGASSFTEWSTPPYDSTTKILKPDFDAAKKELGNGWRMPTGNDFVALLTAGFAEWTSSYNNTGVAGIIFWKAKDGDAGWFKPAGYSANNKKARLIKSSDSGYSYEEITHTFSNTYAINTDPHVFFPAAGYGNNCNLAAPNSQGLYFTSSINEKNHEQANGISIGQSVLFIGGNNRRMLGGSIRPVSTESTAPTPAPTLPACALAGVFSVSATKKVHFSQGNLFYDGSAFKFETKQQDVQSNWVPSHVSNFFWSKSASVAYADSYSDGSAADSDVFFTNATAETANSEFTIMQNNTTTVTGKYRTLSKDEWKYLFDTRTVNGGTGNGKSYSADITYGGKKGVVLYPDNYTGSVLSGEVTALPEDVVFLPSTGFRDGTSITEVSGDKISCIYWTSTADDKEKAYRMFFQWDSSKLSTKFDDNNSRGWAVGIRLVTDVPAESR